jgi:hypoxanthine phosphoribosyltransferase
MSSFRLKKLISRKEIMQKVDKLASTINRQYKDKNPLIIYALIGGKTFFEILTSKLHIPFDTDFVWVKSYTGTKSGEFKWLERNKKDFAGRDCLLIDDILDTGRTMKMLKEYIEKNGAASCKVCVAVDKLERREEDIQPDFVLFRVEKGFLVGLGMDYDEMFRELKDICIIEEDV